MPYNNQQIQTPDEDLQFGGWEVSKLNKLGLYHPLEVSHASFHKGQLETVLKRLADCLRTLSCHVSHQDYGLSAACQTMEQIEFQVSFFEKDREMVVMELQRLCGDSFTFHQYASEILKIVNDKQSLVTQPINNPHRMNDIIPTHIMDKLVDGSCIGEHNMDVTMALVAKLVTADRTDAVRAGMETLETLTDTGKTGWFVASKVARELVMPSTGMSTAIAVNMVRFLFDSTDERDLGYKALHVWSNVFQVAAKHPPACWDTFWDTLCPLDALMRLFRELVEQVHRYPHEATMALLGLSALQQALPHRFGAGNTNAIPWCAVQQANVVGCTHHAALEHASRKVLRAR